MRDGNVGLGYPASCHVCTVMTRCIAYAIISCYLCSKNVNNYSDSVESKAHLTKSV